MLSSLLRRGASPAARALLPPHRAAFAAAANADRLAAVKALREATGAPVVDVKAALQESDWDQDAAFAALRTKGLAAAAKKASRAAAEGLVAARVEAGRGALAELNAETDFAARHPAFRSLVASAAAAAVAAPPPSPAGGELAPSARDAVCVDGGAALPAAAADLAATVRENVVLRRVARLDAPPGGLVASYVHSAVDGDPATGRAAALVAVAPAPPATALPASAPAFARSLAMHVVAARPLALDAASLPPDVVAAETAIFAAQAAAAGKPPPIAAKIAAGRLAKWHEEVVLAAQRLVMDDAVTVSAAAKKEGVIVTGFVRLQVGEGVEKKEADFAAEVAETLKEAS